MRYTVTVTRVQVAERSVHATDAESAARKVQEEFDRPYEYFGTWKTVSSEVEVTEKESVLSTMPNAVSKDGGMLLGLKDAGTALGVSYSTIESTVEGYERLHESPKDRCCTRRSARVTGRASIGIQHCQPQTQQRNFRTAEVADSTR
jgi:hypothetical protein